jgi:hypothetical protein
VKSNGPSGAAESPAFSRGDLSHLQARRAPGLGGRLVRGQAPVRQRGTGTRSIVVSTIAALWVALICMPSARADPLSQEDLKFIEGANSFGFNPTTLKLSRGLPEEAEMGRTICNDLLGRNFYNARSDTKGKVDPDSEVGALRAFLPGMSQDDARILVLNAVTSYNACSNTKLPWIDYSLGRH